MRQRTRRQLRTALAVTAFAAVAWLQGCGGAAIEPEPRAEPGAAQRPLSAVAPLLADDGSVMPPDPRAVPADAGAHTRAGRYATRAQAEQLRGLEIVQVPVDCCRVEAVDEAFGIAVTMQAALNLSDSAVFLVHGPDLRLAATLADRLAAAGFSRVFLVTMH